MVKRSSKNTAKRSSTTLEPHHSAVVLGSLGGAKGGPARAKALTPAKRSSIARKGGIAKAAKRK